MADLKNGKVAVDVARNLNQKGDSGRRARSADSCYLLIGGSTFTYSVTLNWETGHFCKADHSGDACKGNTFGKARGARGAPISKRNTSDPDRWCKHVKAAMADVEAVAEAQELTAQAFGKSVPSDEPAPRTAAIGGARELLAAREAEVTRLREEIAAEDAELVQDQVNFLVKQYGKDAVVMALSKA